MLPPITDTMDTTRSLQKVKLYEIEWNNLGLVGLVLGGKQVEVQFNPASLRVSYSNHVSTKDPSKPAGLPQAGMDNSKLSMELVFDVSVPGQESGAGLQDVRDLTREVAYFIKPRFNLIEQKLESPPGVRMHWGTFLFDGVVVSMDETLELWSEDGRPLRAAVTLNLTQKALEGTSLGSIASTAQGQTGVSPAGTTPLQSALAGESLQSMAERQGKAGNWKDIAAANGIENPRRLSPGRLINL